MKIYWPKIKTEWVVASLILLFGIGLTVSAAAVSASSTKITYISSVDDLEEVRNDLDGYFQVTTSELIIREDWEPIGTEEHPFTGTFEGGDATVIGMGFGNLTSEDNNYCGLFGCNEGTVIHLNFWVSQNEVVSYSGEEDFYLGVVAGINKGKITSCSIGGYTLNVEANNNLYAGLLTGANYGDLRNNLIMDGMTIESSNGNAYAGGLAGVTYDGSIIELNETRSQYWFTSRAENGISSCGNGVGLAKGGTVRDCCFASTVSGNGDSYRGGAIAGTIDSESEFIIEDCYASSGITLYTTNGNIGGLVGIIEDGSAVSLQDCLYSGALRSDSPFEGCFGELVGAGKAEISNSYYLRASTLEGTRNTIGSLISVSELSIQKMGWNSEYWSIEDGTVTFTRRNSE